MSIGAVKYSKVREGMAAVGIAASDAPAIIRTARLATYELLDAMQDELRFCFVRERLVHGDACAISVERFQHPAFDERTWRNGLECALHDRMPGSVVAPKLNRARSR